MRLITFKAKENDAVPAVGLLSPDGSHATLLSSCGVVYRDMNGLIEKITGEEMDILREKSKDPSLYTIPMEDVVLMSPIPYPMQDVICLGLNYTEHAMEAAAYAKDSFVSKDRYPVYFSKRVNYAPGSGEAIPSHEGLVERLDYESELAVIIGKDAYGVDPSDVEKYIFGYTVLNDVSARVLQTRHTQWYFGKSLDGFTPMGPCITTKDEIAFPPKLAITSHVNGELRQNSTTDMLIFGIDRIISELSQGMTLKAGTIISTGTPKGVGMGFDPPKFLKKGDVVTCSIEKIGDLVNPIA